jgi:hypothetical protein
MKAGFVGKENVTRRRGGTRFRFHAVSVHRLNICCTAVQEREGREGMQNGEDRRGLPFRLCLSVCNDAVSTLDAMAWSECRTVKSESEWMWKGAVVA